MRLDAEELEVLSGHGASSLSHAAKLAYILGIRPFMDFETGLVGYKRRVSYQSLRELLEVAPVPGSHREERQLKTDELRTLLRELERVGLIRWIRSRDRGLFFECLAAHRGSPSKNRSHMGATSRTPIRNNTTNASNGAGFMDDEPHREPHQDHGEEPHTSGSPVNTNTTTNAHARANPVDNSGCPACIPMQAWVDYEAERNLHTGRPMSITQRLALWQQLAGMDAEGYDIGKVLMRCVAHGFSTFDRKPELMKKPPGATNQTPGACTSTLKPKRGNYAGHEDIDNSAVAKVRRRAEARERERQEQPGSAVIIEGAFRREAP